MNLERLPLCRLPKGVTSACSNVHNVEAAKGRAGAQCHIPHLEPGESATIADLEGPAIITRFWLTFDWPGTFAYEHSMLRNRSLRLEITWDDATTPAVCVPVGDFFGHPLCYDMSFENALFADPTGRSSLCFIPMPFRRRATIRLVNEFDRRVSVFHDIRLLRGVEPDPDDGYLHACFNRSIPDKPGVEHEILPAVQGRGRYLGTHLGVITDRFNPLHWHGANPMFYLDGDDEYPSMMGASLDDFGGASWAFDKHYMHQECGLILSRNFALGGGHFGMYFHHCRDPLYFAESCAVTIRPIIGMTGENLLALFKEHPGIADRLSLPYPLAKVEERVAANEDVWVECGRQDEFTSVAMYYLDRPDGDHTLMSREQRCAPAWQWPAADADRLLGE